MLGSALSALLAWALLLLGSGVGAKQVHRGRPLPTGPNFECPKTINTAFVDSHHLIDKYFNHTNGRLIGGSVWTDANALEALHMLMLNTGRRDFDGIADNTYIGMHALNTSTDWQAFTGGFIDDAGWVVMAIWRMADFKRAHGEVANIDKYFISAGQLYDKISDNWDDSCGGGVWWTTDHNYKNAITNELFLRISAEGYLRFGNKTYLENAKKTWAWLEQSGMRNSDGLWNDGLTLDCQNNNETTWTYNQGVLASGLAALSIATKNATLISQAEITLDATIKLKTENGILKESCDNVLPGTTPCDIDQQTFKGIWTKHVQVSLELISSYASNSESRTLSERLIKKYSPFLSKQSQAVSQFATNATHDIGSVWYGKDQGGSIYNVKSLPSGIMAHIAAAQFGDCS